MSRLYSNSTSAMVSGLMLALMLPLSVPPRRYVVLSLASGYGSGASLFRDVSQSHTLTQSQSLSLSHTHLRCEYLSEVGESLRCGEL